MARNGCAASSNAARRGLSGRATGLLQCEQVERRRPAWQQHEVRRQGRLVSRLGHARRRVDEDDVGILFGGARARSQSWAPSATFSTQCESIPSPCFAQVARLCCGSASSTATLRPILANSPARLPTMVDLPTPPFRPATAMMAINVYYTGIRLGASRLLSTSAAS